LSFWQVTLRAVPIVVALASTAALGYFLLIQRSQPQVQLPLPQVVQTAPQAPQAPPQEQAVQGQKPVQQSEVQEPDPPVPNPLPPVPSDDKLIILINSALLALNQANETGNYTVLRDMAAPGFRRANSPDRLYQVFSNLRSRNLDLSPIILFQPKLFQRPEINNRGMLRIAGFFPTAPERVNFDLIFQPVRGKWRLYGIAANTQKAPPPQAAQQAAPGPAPEAEPKPAAAEVIKPAPGKKAAAKPKPAAEAEEPAQVDVRDRIDTPPPAPPPAEKPKPKNSIWNPFGR
jgi:hypothetical protein